MHLADEAATLAAGARLARALPALPGAEAVVVWLEGDLGAGKTTLARGLLRALGVTGSVRSPTYTLVEPYRTPAGPAVFHLDLYRLADPEELEMLGYRELLEGGSLLLVEWPQRGRGWLPAADLVLVLGAEGDGRCLRAEPRSDFARRWWQRFEGCEGAVTS